MEGTDPVNKKLAAALSGGAVLALALSGCSSGDETNDKLNSWAKRVCDDVQPQIKKIAAANASIQKETSDDSAPADVQKADSQGFQDISDAYKAAVTELNQLSTAYAELKKKSDALNTKDQAKFADGLEGVATELEKLSKTGSNALKELEKGEVGQAMAEQPSCKSATSSVSVSAGATQS
jgi:hypothetical protein